MERAFSFDLPAVNENKSYNNATKKINAEVITEQIDLGIRVARARNIVSDFVAFSVAASEGSEVCRSRGIGVGE